MHASEKWKWSRSVVSDSLRPHGLQPTRLLCPWHFPGMSTGVGCHCLLHPLRQKVHSHCSPSFSSGWFSQQGFTFLELTRQSEQITETTVTKRIHCLGKQETGKITPSKSQAHHSSGRPPTQLRGFWSESSNTAEMTKKVRPYPSPATSPYRRVENLFFAQQHMASCQL